MTMIIARRRVKLSSGMALGMSWVGRVAIMIMFPMVTADVVLRYLFNSPIQGSYEMVQGLTLLAMTMNLAYVQDVKGHINVDLLFPRFPPRVRYALELVFWLVSLALFATLAWLYVFAFGESWAIKERTMGLVQQPLYLAKGLVLLGSVSMSLVLIVDIVRTFRNLLRPPLQAAPGATTEDVGI